MVIKLYEEVENKPLDVKPCKLALRETDGDGDLDVHVLDDVDIKIAKASGIGIDGAVMKTY